MKIPTIYLSQVIRFTLVTDRRTSGTKSGDFAIGKFLPFGHVALKSVRKKGRRITHSSEYFQEDNKK